MSAELFLIAPSDLPADRLLAALGAALAAHPASAVLLQRGELAENAYKALVKAVAPTAQKAGAAVLIEGEPGLVRMLGVDGLHVSGGIKAVREAVSALKPSMIVGVGDIGTRHDAMQKAELDIDYILFGPLSGAISEPERELAQWWAETMEIPSVLSDPSATIEKRDAGGSEFIGLVLPEIGT
ncbi:thiamine phosphate synthase [Devosia sp.]|uniref:thiamine phosphate synthase n=1 Tax=Devosia sp. TaxID=1871048 RepID=UPI003BA9E972